MSEDKKFTLRYKEEHEKDLELVKQLYNENTTNKAILVAISETPKLKKYLQDKIRECNLKDARIRELERIIKDKYFADNAFTEKAKELLQPKQENRLLDILDDEDN